MVSAVIFDFYGTLAHSADRGAANDAASYQTIFAAHGYALDQAVLNDYYSRYDGVEHGEDLDVIPRHEAQECDDAEGNGDDPPDDGQPPRQQGA